MAATYTKRYDLDVQIARELLRALPYREVWLVGCDALDNCHAQPMRLPLLAASACYPWRRGDAGWTMRLRGMRRHGDAAMPDGALRDAAV